MGYGIRPATRTVTRAATRQSLDIEVATAARESWEAYSASLAEADPATKAQLAQSAWKDIFGFESEDDATAMDKLLRSHVKDLQRGVRSEVNKEDDGTYTLTFRVNDRHPGPGSKNPKPADNA